MIKLCAIVLQFSVKSFHLCETVPPLGHKTFHESNLISEKLSKDPVHFLIFTPCYAKYFQWGLLLIPPFALVEDYIADQRCSLPQMQGVQVKTFLPAIVTIDESHIIDCSRDVQVRFQNRA